MKMIFASSNAGKLRELQTICKNFSVIPQSELGINDIEETGLTFVENALLKARNASKEGRLPALADDSGLVIPALDGAPGIYSARYAGLEANPQKNIAKVLQALQNIPDEKRNAYFYCCIVFLLHENDPTPLICQGVWQGRILHSAQGENGFGYDPIFFVPEENKAAAQLSLERKNQISHRGKALRDFMLELPLKLRT